MSNSSPLRAGVARSDITTDDPNAQIGDRLFARALVLADDTTTYVLVTMDVTAIGARAISDGALPDVSESFLPELRKRIEAELGLSGSHVTVNASHTHPLGRMLCDDGQQIERTFDAVRRAWQTMTPVRIGSGVGIENTISMNRTLRLKDGRHWTIRHANPCPNDAEVEAVGPVDPQVGVIRVDRLDGTPLAVVYNFACHRLFGHPDGRITANFPGVASRLIESSLGNDVTALFIQGAAGDVIDVGFKNFTEPREIESFGLRLGLSVLETHRKIQPGDADLRFASVAVEFPRRTDLAQRIEELQNRQDQLVASLRSCSLNFDAFLPLWLGHQLRPQTPSDYAHRYLRDQQAERDTRAQMDDFVRGHVEKYRQNIRAMEELSRVVENIATLRKHADLNAAAGTAGVAAELQAVRIGECAIVAAPLEVLTEVSLSIKAASPCPQTWIAGFSNGYLHYGPPAEAYARGGYEVNECLLAPEWQRLFEATANRLLRTVCT
ncbi:MAG: hypothetical protein ACTHLN_16510 [Tepidisphaeraceae bacterium]